MRAAADPVRNVFLGTSEFAAATLRRLAGSPHRPGLVVTPPDRRRGRGRRVGSPPAADAARELGIDLHQTASVNEPGSRRAIAERRPELGMVCAFGQLIAEPLLSELAMLNLHPSLLPRWRGAAPIERALIAGDRRTGVCVIRLTAGLDSGPVALREELEIGAREDYGSLAPRLAALGGELLVGALDLHAAGALELTEQGDGGVTYAEKLDSAERRVDPGRPAEELARLIRGLTPHIGAYLDLGDGGRIGLRGPEPRAGGLAPGELRGDEGRLLIGCSPGTLAISEVQPAGGRWMDAAAYLRGHGPPAPAAG